MRRGYDSRLGRLEALHGPSMFARQEALVADSPPSATRRSRCGPGCGRSTSGVTLAKAFTVSGRMELVRLPV